MRKHRPTKNRLSLRLDLFPSCECVVIHIVRPKNRLSWPHHNLFLFQVEHRWMQQHLNAKYINTARCQFLKIDYEMNEHCEFASSQYLQSQTSNSMLQHAPDLGR